MNHRKKRSMSAPCALYAPGDLLADNEAPGSGCSQVVRAVSSPLYSPPPLLSSWQFAELRVVVLTALATYPPTHNRRCSNSNSPVSRNYKYTHRLVVSPLQKTLPLVL